MRFDCIQQGLIGHCTLLNREKSVEITPALHDEIVMTAKQSTSHIQAVKRLSSCHWDAAFSPASFDRGIDYAIANQVENLSVDLAGNWFEVKSSVRGSRQEPYEVRLHFAAIGPLSLTGRCSSTSRVR